MFRDNVYCPRCNKRICGDTLSIDTRHGGSSLIHQTCATDDELVLYRNGQARMAELRARQQQQLDLEVAKRNSSKPTAPPRIASLLLACGALSLPQPPFQGAFDEED